MGQYKFSTNKNRKCTRSQSCWTTAKLVFNDERARAIFPKPWMTNKQIIPNQNQLYQHRITNSPYELYYTNGNTNIRISWKILYNSKNHQIWPSRWTIIVSLTGAWQNGFHNRKFRKYFNFFFLSLCYRWVGFHKKIFFRFFSLSTSQQNRTPVKKKLFLAILLKSCFHTRLKFL